VISSILIELLSVLLTSVLVIRFKPDFYLWAGYNDHCMMVAMSEKLQSAIVHGWVDVPDGGGRVQEVLGRMPVWELNPEVFYVERMWKWVEWLHDMECELRDEYPIVANRLGNIRRHAQRYICKLGSPWGRLNRVLFQDPHIRWQKSVCRVEDYG